MDGVRHVVPDLCNDMKCPGGDLRLVPWNQEQIRVRWAKEPHRNVVDNEVRRCEGCNIKTMSSWIGSQCSYNWRLVADDLYGAAQTTHAKEYMLQTFNVMICDEVTVIMQRRHDGTGDRFGDFLSQQRPNMPECVHVKVASAYHSSDVSPKASWLAMMKQMICSLVVTNGTNDSDTDSGYSWMSSTSW